MEKEIKFFGIVGVIVALLIGAAFSRPPGPAPQPTPIIEPKPDDSIDKGEPIKPVERPALTEIAAESFAAQGDAYARNLREAGRKWRAGDFESPAAAHAWLKPRNIEAHKEAYRAFNLMLDDNADRLGQAFDEAADGFEGK